MDCEHYFINTNPPKVDCCSNCGKHSSEIVKELQAELKRLRQERKDLINEINSFGDQLKEEYDRGWEDGYKYRAG